MLNGELMSELLSCVALIDDDPLDLVISEVDVNEEKRSLRLDVQLLLRLSLLVVILILVLIRLLWDDDLVTRVANG